MLEIWGRRTSSNVQALMWCVAELGLEHERHDAGLSYGMTDTDAFFEMNPNRTVPVLRDNGGPPLWETGAILRYLAAKYGSDPFWPVDMDARAQVDKWAEWAKVSVAVAFTAPVFWRVVRTSEANRDPAAIADALTRLNTKLEISDRRLQEHDWICGDHFTLADIQLGHLLYRYFDIDIERPDWPGLRAYYQRLLGRAAYQEHVVVLYEELRDTL